MPFSEDSCLLSMLFVAEQDKTESAFYDDFPSSDLHCIFQFHSGFKIRVFAAEVRCNIGT